MRLVEVDLNNSAFPPGKPTPKIALRPLSSPLNLIESNNSADYVTMSHSFYLITTSFIHHAWRRRWQTSS